jgi:hypothetical protein
MKPDIVVPGRPAPQAALARPPARPLPAGRVLPVVLVAPVAPVALAALAALAALPLAAGGCATAPPPYEQFYVSEERDPPCAYEVLQELRLETELGDRRREGAILDALEDDLRRAIRNRGGSGIIGLRYEESEGGHVSVTGTIIRFTDLDCAHREQQTRSRRAAAERR